MYTHQPKKPVQLNRSIFQKKSLRTSTQQKRYDSPTDHMLSPCSKKLDRFKSNIFKIRKSQPMKLRFNLKETTSM